MTGQHCCRDSETLTLNQRQRPEENQDNIVSGSPGCDWPRAAVVVKGVWLCGWRGQSQLCLGECEGHAPDVILDNRGELGGDLR